MSVRTFRACIVACVAAATLGGLGALGVSALAEPAGNIDLNAFHPAMDSRGYITVNASQVLGDKEISFGLGALDWGHSLLKLDGMGNTYSIDDMIGATLIGAFGIHAGPAELEFGASVPFIIMSGDRGPDVGQNQFKLDGQGIGNIGLHFKTRFLKTSRGPHIGLGVIASVYLPTVSPTDRFLGEASRSGNTTSGKLVPQVMGILDKEFGRTGRLRMSLNGGIRIRSSETFVNNDPGNDLAPVTNNTVTAGSEIPFGLGIAYALSRQKFDIVGELIGSIPLGDHTNYQPLEALGGVKLYLARNSFLSLGLGRGLVPDKGANPGFRAMIGIVFEPNIGDRDGDGIKDDVDKCPDEPEDFDGFEDEDGCPDPDNDHDGVPDVDDRCPDIPGPKENDGCPITANNDRDGDGIPDNVDKCPDEPEDKDGYQDADGCPDPDNDGDGIPDNVDLCPNDPEDKDGFEDADGCPDPDNDHDRIPDKDDKCPNEPETYNGYQDADGCPDRGRVVVTDTSIEILDVIYFEYDKAVILPKSFPILDAVAATLQGNPSIQLVEIQGHTDERGDDAYNLDLSDRRAKAVMKYLVDKGVDAKRLTAQGYGETQPLDRRHNEAAWAKNRRVAFLIIKRTTD
ncbi:MAG TPA: OmpA family protein [Kofleriaceae bacterium]|jgi:outer membrane protein OmpA-like peptidoglycan-associated protein|nr:OmpA family protein [Kofleriaceae bacterium]